MTWVLAIGLICLAIAFFDDFFWWAEALRGQRMEAREHGHDIDGQDLDQRFAQFGRRHLSDAEVWALSMATMMMPDGSPGPEGYLSKVSGTTLYAPRLMAWGLGVASGISQAGYMARNGRRRRAYVEGYDEAWGRYAVADGLTLVLYGHAEKNAADRVSRLGCGRQAFERIRDFVAGALLSAIAEFVVALEWSAGKRRDRMLEGRWEAVTGLKWSDALAHVRLGSQEGPYLRLSPGCYRTPPARTDQDTQDRHDPEVMNPAMKPDCLWREYPVSPVISYAPPRKDPPRC